MLPLPLQAPAPFQCPCPTASAHLYVPEQRDEQRAVLLLLNVQAAVGGRNVEGRVPRHLQAVQRARQALLKAIRWATLM